ncbi:sorting nexin-1/2 [Schistosoma bovis]|uniref:Sorting nexin-1/2 n=1 Tax=Schistosoma bovis TaxID=6184 RepID=A0A430QJZ8_SCHBO|nr:sorting nexin-1/2 [Schistosoma bovis]
MLEDEFAELDLNENSENTLNVPLNSESYLPTGFTPERNVTHGISPIDTGKETVNTVSDVAFVKVTSPAKVGEGISSYIVYRVNTKVCDHNDIIFKFNGKEFSVLRRFSDFLGLHERLVAKYLSEGVIVPPVPSKDMLGNGLVLFYALQLQLKFLSRVLSHPVLHIDEDVCEFLRHEGELPRATNTQLLSGAAAIKVMKNLGDAIGKFAYKVDDPEEFFYQKADELDSWEKQLKRLHSSLLNLVSGDNVKKQLFQLTSDLANAEAGLARSVLLLANVEENTGLAQALHHLAETEGHDVLSERVRIYRTWKTAEANLRSKREQKIRMEMAPRNDNKKMATITMELEDLENRVDQAQHKFNNISINIKREFQNFDLNRFAYFKQATTEYLELLLQIQLKIDFISLPLYADFMHIFNNNMVF